MYEEGITAFAGRLSAASEKCRFYDTNADAVENCQLRDRLISGLCSNKIRCEFIERIEAHPGQSSR